MTNGFDNAFDLFDEIRNGEIKLADLKKWSNKI